MISWEERSAVSYHVHIKERGTYRQPPLVGADQFIYFLPCFEGKECGHLLQRQRHDPGFSEKNAYSSNFNFLGNVWRLIDIDTIKLDRSGFFREFFKDGADHPARATPSCPKVKDDDLVPVDLIID
jgi:hypothetical protein